MEMTCSSGDKLLLRLVVDNVQQHSAGLQQVHEKS